MDDKHAKNKAKKTWLQDDIDTSFLQNEVQQDIKVKASKQKVKPPPVSHSYYLEYEEQQQAAKKKAKDIKRKRMQRQGVKYDSSDEEKETNDNTNESYIGNFGSAPVSKWTKKKKKRIAKKRKAEEREPNNEELEEEEESSSTDSSDDTTPNVRYGGNTGGRRKFGGIGSKKKKAKEAADAQPSSSSDEEEYRRKRNKKRKKSKQMSSDSETESDDANIAKIIPFKWQKAKGIALEFEENEHVFMEMLSSPDGVLCGGETLMYYESPLDGKKYIYLATDEDEDVIGVLQYDVAREKWSKFCDYPAGFLPDLHGNCVDIAKHKMFVFDRKQFGVLDLRSKKWTIPGGGSKNRTYSDTVSRVVTAYDPVDMDAAGSPIATVKPGQLQLLGIQSVYMAPPIDGIHVFGRTKIPPGSCHLLLDEERKYVALNGFDRDELMRGHKLVYAAGCSKLIVCGGQRQDEFDKWIDSDSIWICDVHSSYQKTGFNWRRLKCRLPFGGKTFGIVCAYDCVLVVIYLRDNEKKEIYCLDLMQQETQYSFVQSSEIFPFDGDQEYTDVIAVGTHVHCMYFSSFGHCKLSLYHIIPRKIKHKLKVRSQTTVNGFLRKRISNKLALVTPMTIINACAKYLSEL